MKSRFLFSYWCRYLGYACILAHVPIVLARKMMDSPRLDDGPDLFNAHHVFFLTTTLLMLVGLIIVAFSKEKIEDEQISQLRLDSVQWALYLNYVLLIVSLVFSTDVYHILFVTRNRRFVAICQQQKIAIFFFPGFYKLLVHQVRLMATDKSIIFQNRLKLIYRPANQKLFAVLQIKCAVIVG